MKIKVLPAAVIVGVISNLVNRVDVGNTSEEQLVLTALRRYSRKTAEMTNEELGDYIGSMNEAQLKGLMNNIKGITLESYVMTEENQDGDDITMEQFANTNHAGADLQVIQEGVHILDLQVKATSNPNYIEEHFSKYPDMPVIATSDVAHMDGVDDAGITNKELTDIVNDTLDELDSLDTLSQVTQSAGIGGIAAGAITVKQMIAGDVKPEEVKKRLGEGAIVSGGSSLIMELLLG